MKTTVLELENSDLEVYNSALSKFVIGVNTGIPISKVTYDNIHSNCLEMSKILPQTRELDSRVLSNSLKQIYRAIPLMKGYAPSLAKLLEVNYGEISEFLTSAGQNVKVIEMSFSSDEGEEPKDCTDYDKLTEEIVERELYGKDSEKELSLREKLNGATSKSIKQLAHSMIHKNDNVRPIDQEPHEGWNALMQGLKVLEKNKGEVPNPQSKLFDELMSEALSGLAAQKIEYQERWKKICEIARKNGLKGYHD